MTGKGKISRKKFFRYFLYLLGLPLMFSWKKLVESHSDIYGMKRQMILPGNLPNGITIQDELLIRKDENNLAIFSSRCTHLGCQINKYDADGFVCPCHGSRFSFNGDVEDGPAYKPLNRLEYTIDPKTNNIFVKLNG